jgi:hypothetical protein
MLSSPKEASRRGFLIPRQRLFLVAHLLGLLIAGFRFFFGAGHHFIELPEIDAVAGPSLIKNLGQLLIFRVDNLHQLQDRVLVAQF